MTTELNRATFHAIAMLDAAGYWHYKIAIDKDAGRKEVYALKASGIYKSVLYRRVIITKKSELALYESYLASKNI